MSTESMTTCVKDFIELVLTKVSKEIEEKIENKFISLGIESQKDIIFVKEEDFLDILTPIQIRKINSWKEGLSRADSVSPSSSNTSFMTVPPPSPATSSTSTTTSESEYRFNKNAEWAETVPIPYSKIIPKMVLSELDKNNLSSENRRLFVRNIVQEMRKHNENISTNQYKIISRRIVQKYKCFEDNLCGQVIGSGNDSLANQLINRNDNCNRGKTPFGRKKRKTDTDSTKALTKKDAYGCIQFSPGVIDQDQQESIRDEMVELFNTGMTVEDFENKFKITYPLQRKEINSQEFDTSELLKHWPLLFKSEGIVIHFKLLTGIQVVEAFDNFLAEKGERIVTFLGKRTPTLSNIVNGLVLKMKERKEDLFIFTDSNSTEREVESLIKEVTPKIVVLGPTLEDAKEFIIMIDGLIVTRCCSFKLAFICYISLYYILNIKYPESIESTLEFFQRIVLGINPQAGSKAKKRKNCVNARVLKFIAEISSFEWTPSTLD